MSKTQYGQDGVGFDYASIEKVPRHRSTDPVSERYIEAQLQAVPEADDYHVSTLRKVVCLIVYFFLNLGLTISNKRVLQLLPAPWLLTASHATVTTAGCFVLHHMGYFQCTVLDLRQKSIFIIFSCLFTANIATSNISLWVTILGQSRNADVTTSRGLVSVPFHQVLRSTVPVVTIMIYRLVYSRKYSRQTYWTMVPLVGGVGLATFGDYHFTVQGFSLTSLGVLLAAVKSIASNQLMTGNLRLPALEVLYLMSPHAALQSILCAFISGEVDIVRSIFEKQGVIESGLLAILLLNALMAFMLNVISFYTNKVAGQCHELCYTWHTLIGIPGALTISVCANLKQVTTILLGIVMFKVVVSPVHGIGMIVAFFGAAWYSKVELDKRRVPMANTAKSLPPSKE